MKTALLELHYLPCLDYFAVLAAYPNVLLEANESYSKQSYRNRCVLQTPQGRITLSVPIIGGQGHQPIREVQIDYSQKWQTQHWRTIQSAYGKAPFFEFFADDLQGLLFKEYKSLWDLNETLLYFVIKNITLRINIQYTESFRKEYEGLIVEDFRDKIHPKKNTIYTHTPYLQVFGEKFEENLSILDLLFCKGNQALLHLKKST